MILGAKNRPTGTFSWLTLLVENDVEISERRSRSKGSLLNVPRGLFFFLLFFHHAYQFSGSRVYENGITLFGW